MPDAALLEQAEIELEEIEAYYCADCGAISLESAGPLYECRDCAIPFTRDDSADGCSHRCPDCNRFSAKIGSDGCAECGEGEVQEITAYECPTCEEPVPLEDWADHKADHAPASDTQAEAKALMSGDQASSNSPPKMTH